VAADPYLSGSFNILVLFDVAEEIRLEELRTLIGAAPGPREPEFRHPAPDYIRLERTPVTETIDPVCLESGERLEGRLKYYDYGVVSIELALHFEGDWGTLIQLSSRWIGSPDVERSATKTVEKHLSRIAPTLVKKYSSWLSEDYYILRIDQARRPDGTPLTAAELIDQDGGAIARAIRGEAAALSKAEQSEVLQGSISYYPSDLLVVGWTAALVYDTPEGAAPVIQLLEYANAQLLEFRHYDDLLTSVLARVYRSLDRKSGLLWRWRLAREAQWLNTIRLDVKELTERADISLKFLSDMFYARMYRLAAARIGVTDYRNLVEDKLRTAGELYAFMVDQFHQSRAFVLELMIVVILIIDLVFLFRGL
jgi:hypothetical protein